MCGEERCARGVLAPGGSGDRRRGWVDSRKPIFTWMTEPFQIVTVDIPVTAATQ